VSHISVRILAPPEHARDVGDSLRALARRARQDSACCFSEVYASLDDQNQLVLREDWAADDALARYLRSDDFDQVLTLIELGAAPPVLEFQVAGRIRGLDYLTEVRGTSES
jgi:quinol monooxygenase YgiN